MLAVLFCTCSFSSLHCFVNFLPFFVLSLVLSPFCTFSLFELCVAHVKGPTAAWHGQSIHQPYATTSEFQRQRHLAGLFFFENFSFFFWELLFLLGLCFFLFEIFFLFFVLFFALRVSVCLLACSHLCICFCCVVVFSKSLCSFSYFPFFAFASVLFHIHVLN